MATKSGKRNTKSSNHKKNTTRKTTGKQADTFEISSEVKLILLLAICVVLFLCNFGIVGMVGDFLSNIEFGLFGLLAYIAPVFFFLSVAFGMTNQGNPVAMRKLIAAQILFFLIGILLEMWGGCVSNMENYDAGLLYQNSSNKHAGGGIIAGSIAYLLYHQLDIVGTLLCVLVIGIICFIIITEKSFVEGVKKGGRRLQEYSDEEHIRRQEKAILRKEQSKTRKEEIRKQREEREKQERERKEQQLREKALDDEARENEKILRMEKKISGVSADTTLQKSKPAMYRDDIHEIMIDTEEPVEELEHTTDSEATYISAPPIISPAVSSIHEIQFHGEHLDTPVVEPISMKPDEPQEATVKEKEIVSKENDVKKDIVQVDKAPSKNVPVKDKPYSFPPLSLLNENKKNAKGDSRQKLAETAKQLEQTLATFGVKVTVTDISQGPAVTRYELQPEQGVKVSKIVGLADDIKLNLAATDIRIEAPIPGKAAVGIEVPNKENSAVALRELLESSEYKNFSSKIAFAVGKDIGGKVVVADIGRMPHMLIAGSTGSGKSVCINTIIMSILYKAHPDEVKMILIDPKVVELSVYNGIPHLLIPVVTDPKKASGALHWGVAEMTDRYQKFADFNVRDLKGYNQKVDEMQKTGAADAPSKLPQIVIIVDELADLMMVAPGEVEESICRLAQLARAAGIHLIIATQRPSVDVITGLIKANMPSRVAFAVSSGVDSRTILDMNGAEKLLGKGDMLFYPQGYPKPARVQGAFVSDHEVSNVVDFLKNQAIGNVYNDDIELKIKSMESSGGGASQTAGTSGSGYDELFAEAGRFIIEKDKASIGMLQRVFKIGFNRAARIMDQLAEAGVVGEEEGTKPRKILMSPEQFENYMEEYL